MEDEGGINKGMDWGIIREGSNRNRRGRGGARNLSFSSPSFPVSVPLESTLEETLEDDSAPDALDKQRLGLTVWVTTSSTYTVTSTSTNSSTTFSLSYYCSIVGANLAPACR